MACDTVDRQKQRAMLYKEGHTLAKADYIQSESDTPELDVENGRFSEVEESKGAGQNSRES